MRVSNVLCHQQHDYGFDRAFGVKAGVGQTSERPLTNERGGLLLLEQPRIVDMNRLRVETVEKKSAIKDRGGGWINNIGGKTLGDRYHFNSEHPSLTSTSALLPGAEDKGRMAR